MRDLQEIDSDLLLVAEVRAALIADGVDPMACGVDDLLDERLLASAHAHSDMVFAGRISVDDEVVAPSIRLA